MCGLCLPNVHYTIIITCFLKLQCKFTKMMLIRIYFLISTYQSG